MSTDQLLALESLYSRDIGKRGIAKLACATRGHLAGAAQSLATQASASLAIVTGFYTSKGEPPSAETDGPIGAVHLALGLRQAGIPAIIVTDEPCASAVNAAVNAVSEAIPLVVAAPTDHDFTRLRTQIVEHLPTLSHLVSVERVGPAHDGVPRNIRGEDISGHTLALHRLFEKNFFTSRPTTIGIGDGGNEIGMGSVDARLIAQNVRNGEQLACVTATDYLLVSGVSNWGAIALLAALASIRSDLRGPLLRSLNRQSDLAILKQMVWQGPSVDGVTCQQTLSVDGLHADLHGDYIDDVLAIVMA